MVDGDETRSATVEGLRSTSATSSTSSAGRAGAQVELAPSVLIDRYRIERRIGAGGMGVVYAARDAHLGRAVAIKLVGPRIDPGPGQGRLAREAQAMANFSHPNIATVYDIGSTGDRLFVVMELIDGGTVADWLKAEPRSWREVVGVYLQAARGLAAAHAAGFVHRDFKPENVLLGRDGVARVSDFGVARMLGEAERALPADGTVVGGSGTRTGGVGTPGYIAPEILRHQAVDGRADQFSLCVAIHAALYGERPFAPLAGPGRMAETLGALRPPPGGVVPRWLQRIVTRGLAADPRDRWPTIAAFAAAIERRLGRRRRALALAVAASTAFAAVVLVKIGRPAPPPAPDWSPVAIGRETRDTPHGAHTTKLGLIDAAGSGVLFLDELGELPLDVQGDFLRFLEDGSFRPVGSTRLRRSGARIVAATNVDLDDFVRSGRFRRDLLARLRASNPPLELPPLRRRPEDIIDWARRFAIEAEGTCPARLFSAGAAERLLLQPWPENLRELRGLVRSVMAGHPQEPLLPEDLPDRFRAHRKALRGDDIEPRPSAVAPAEEPTREQIEAALAQTGGRMRTAAQLLGVDRRKLYRLCERGGIDVDLHRKDARRKGDA